jgi:hypothetical protein
MKTIILLASLMGVASLNQAQKPEDFGLPELHKVKSITLAPSYSCRSQEEARLGYQNTALFLSALSLRRNTPELLFEGACGVKDQFRSMTSGDDLGVIADLGEISLEKVTARLAFNTRDEDSFDMYSKFAQAVQVQANHTYAALVAHSDIKSLFVFTVTGYVPNKRVDLQYAVKEYQVLGLREQSPGFGWRTESKSDLKK